MDYVDNKDGQAWYLLGRCYMVINNFEEAYHAYKQAMYVFLCLYRMHF